MMQTQPDKLSDAFNQLHVNLVPKEFTEQYGNIVENAQVVSPMEQEIRRRSISAGTAVAEPQQSYASSVASNPQKNVAPVQNGGKKNGPFYVVEFKGGRNDFFYVPEDSDLFVKVGDLVIVEADRGKDLGKVIHDSISQAELKQMAPSANKDIQNPQDGTPTPTKEIEPKCIYRHALPNEVNMLLEKARDETKCLAIVQAKARQKNLPMEIVDAEYQWDRRKLTFYFVSEQRIDFRELVKDLFKIYKTRIWMCAVERSRTGVRLMRNT
jgi:hypothetical protein